MAYHLTTSQSLGSPLFWTSNPATLDSPELRIGHSSCFYKATFIASTSRNLNFFRFSLKSRSPNVSVSRAAFQGPRAAVLRPPPELGVSSNAVEPTDIQAGDPTTQGPGITSLSKTRVCRVPFEEAADKHFLLAPVRRICALRFELGLTMQLIRIYISILSKACVRGEVAPIGGGRPNVPLVLLTSSELGSHTHIQMISVSHPRRGKG